MNKKHFINGNDIDKIKSNINGLKDSIKDKKFLNFLDYGLNFFSESILRKYCDNLIIDNEEITIFYWNNIFKLSAFPSFQNIELVSLYIKVNGEQKQVKLKYDNERNLYVLESIEITPHLNEFGDISFNSRKEEFNVIRDERIIYKKVFSSSTGLFLEDNHNYASSEEEFIFSNEDVLRNFSATTFNASAHTHIFRTKGFTSKLNESEYYELLDKFYNEILDIREVIVLKKRMN